MIILFPFNVQVFFKMQVFLQCAFNYDLILLCKYFLECSDE